MNDKKNGQQIKFQQYNYTEISNQFLKVLEMDLDTNNLIIYAIIEFPLDFIFKSANNYTFGAFITFPFNNSNKNFRDDKAFLFQLDYLSRHNAYQHQDFAVLKYPSWLILFGGDIAIKNDCNNNHSSYSSFGFTYQPPAGIDYKSPESKSYLAGSMYFYIKEMEVFQLNK